MSPRPFALVSAAVALFGALSVSAAQAHGADVRASVTIAAPLVTLTLPVPVLRLPVPAPVVWVSAPRPVFVPEHSRGGTYRAPTRWDVDGDGIPNRYDRLYNPTWDRNGDGIRDDRGYAHHPRGDRDHDGVPNRYDRRDDRFDHRFDHRPDDRRPIGEWRGPR